jgi:hypothetical protein
MVDTTSLLFLLIPVAAFIHGYFTGKKEGIKYGANTMFDLIANKGEKVPGTKFIRVQLEVEDELRNKDINR